MASAHSTAATPSTEATSSPDGDVAIAVLPHWIAGRPVPGRSGRRGEIFDPATGRVARYVDFATASEVAEAVDSASEAFEAWRHSSLSQRSAVLFAFRELMAREGGRVGVGGDGRARQGPRRRHRRGPPRARGRRVRLRDPTPDEGRLLRVGLDRGRHLLDPPAARRGRGREPVQLSGDGALLVRAHRHRLGQRGDPQAEREGSFGRQLDGGALGRGGPPRRCLQRGPRRQGDGRRPRRPPGRAGGVLRRFDAGRPFRLRTGHRDRQAGAGARWGEEPHGGAARRRARPGGRRGGERGLRLRGRALHGHLGRRGRRPDRRPAGRRHRRAHGAPVGRRRPA